MTQDPTVVASDARTHRRVKKRLAIPLGLLFLVTAVIAWLAVLGTWAETEPRDPKLSSEGIITQLLKVGDGKQVRAATVINHPIDDVWAVVTDYEHFSEIFPHVCHTDMDRLGDGSCRLSGAASAGIFGEWPFHVHIKHQQSPDAYVASWDEPFEDLKVNRGSWTLKPLDEDRTLAVYALETKVGKYPDFIVRSALMLRQDAVVGAIARAVEHRHETAQ